MFVGLERVSRAGGRVSLSLNEIQRLLDVEEYQRVDQTTIPECLF